MSKFFPKFSIRSVAVLGSPTMFLCSLFLVALLASTTSGDSDPFDKYSLPTLKRMIYVRGLWCSDCTDAEYRTMARKNAALPINEALAEEYDDALAYETKKKELQITKPDFVQQMNTSSGDSIDFTYMRDPLKCFTVVSQS